MKTFAVVRSLLTKFFNMLTSIDSGSKRSAEDEVLCRGVGAHLGDARAGPHKFLIFLPPQAASQ